LEVELLWTIQYLENMNNTSVKYFTFLYLVEREMITEIRVLIVQNDGLAISWTLWIPLQAV
jgi:hypothetical protein